MRKINMSGLRFGRLTVLCEDGRLNGEVSWKCKCDCGNIKIVRGSHLRKLPDGISVSNNGRAIAITTKAAQVITCIYPYMK